MTDTEIIDLFLARSQEAIPSLQRQYGSYCSAIAHRILRDKRDAEECLNDCWLSVWTAIPPTRPVHLKGWLGAIVRNRALAIAQEQDRYSPAVEDISLELSSFLPSFDDAFNDAVAKELGSAISAFLWTQKSSYRIAFLRRYWYLDSLEEVAARMGWSTSKTKSVLFRIRNKLWDHLLKEGFV